MIHCPKRKRAAAIAAPDHTSGQAVRTLGK